MSNWERRPRPHNGIGRVSLRTPVMYVEMGEHRWEILRTRRDVLHGSKLTRGGLVSLSYEGSIVRVPVASPEVDDLGDWSAIPMWSVQLQGRKEPEMVSPMTLDDAVCYMVGAWEVLKAYEVEEALQRDGVVVHLANTGGAARQGRGSVRCGGWAVDDATTSFRDQATCKACLDA